MDFKGAGGRKSYLGRYYTANGRWATKEEMQQLTSFPETLRIPLISLDKLSEKDWPISSPLTDFLTHHLTFDGQWRCGEVPRSSVVLFNDQLREPGRLNLNSTTQKFWNWDYSNSDKSPFYFPKLTITGEELCSTEGKEKRAQQRMRIRLDRNTDPHRRAPSVDCR